MLREEIVNWCILKGGKTESQESFVYMGIPLSWFSVESGCRGVDCPLDVGRCFRAVKHTERYK